MKFKRPDFQNLIPGFVGEGRENMVRVPFTRSRVAGVVVARASLTENASEVDQSNRSVQVTQLQSAPQDLSSVVPCPVIGFYTSN